MDAFLRAFQLVIGHEGGFQNDRQDRGNWTSGIIGRGELKGTKYGIAAHSYPELNIEALTLDDARKIYRLDYWNVVRGDDLPWPLSYLAFDAAVNHGPGQAARFLQEAVGAKVDGAIGPKTIAACKAVSDVQGVAIRFCRARAVFMVRIPGERFDPGWIGRVFDTLETALDAAAHAPVGE